MLFNYMLELTKTEILLLELLKGSDKKIKKKRLH